MKNIFYIVLVTFLFSLQIVSADYLEGRSAYDAKDYKKSFFSQACALNYENGCDNFKKLDYQK